MPSIESILAVVGAISTLCTALAAIMPKGSRAGKAFATIGADLKGQNR